MQIVELGENSMVIMKDSDDSPWESVGDIYRRAIRETYKNKIAVETEINYYSSKPLEYPAYQVSSDYIYSGGRLILFFSDSVCPYFHLHDRVKLTLKY